MIDRRQELIDDGYERLVPLLSPHDSTTIPWTQHWKKTFGQNWRRLLKLTPGQICVLGTYLSARETLKRLNDEQLKRAFWYGCDTLYDFRFSGLLKDATSIKQIKDLRDDAFDLFGHDVVDWKPVKVSTLKKKMQKERRRRLDEITNHPLASKEYGPSVVLSTRRYKKIEYLNTKAKVAEVAYRFRNCAYTCAPDCEDRWMYMFLVDDSQLVMFHWTGTLEDFKGPMNSIPPRDSVLLELLRDTTRQLHKNFPLDT